MVRNINTVYMKLKFLKLHISVFLIDDREQLWQETKKNTPSTHTVTQHELTPTCEFVVRELDEVSSSI